MGLFSLRIGRYWLLIVSLTQKTGGTGYRWPHWASQQGGYRYHITPLTKGTGRVLALNASIDIGERLGNGP